MDENKNEVAVSLEANFNRKVVAVEDTMAEGDIWEWNVMLGYGNDVY